MISILLLGSADYNIYSISLFPPYLVTTWIWKYRVLFTMYNKSLSLSLLSILLLPGFGSVECWVQCMYI